MPKAKLNGKAQEVPVEYSVTMNLLESFKTTWRQKLEEQLADPVTFSRLSVVALTQLAAVVAVDVGMSLDQFTAVNRANYNEAFKKAPRFS